MSDEKQVKKQAENEQSLDMIATYVNKENFSIRQPNAIAFISPDGTTWVKMLTELPFSTLEEIKTIARHKRSAPSLTSFLHSEPPLTVLNFNKFNYSGERLQF